MTLGLPRRALPRWLEFCHAASAIPTRDLLSGSVFYPAAGDDGKPVRFLGGYCHSFIYVDYTWPCERVVERLHAPAAFRGYRPVFGRNVALSDLKPANDLEPFPIDPATDGDPERYRSRIVSPYAYWAVFERSSSFSDNHGPARFSLLYLGMEGVYAFRWLFHGHLSCPEVIAIIQPGEGFGFNWTAFHAPDKPLARAIRANPVGKPAYLLRGGYGLKLEQQREQQWEDYPHLMRFLKTTDGYLGLWSQHAPINATT